MTTARKVGGFGLVGTTLAALLYVAQPATIENVSFRTHDGQHYLTVEPDGRVVADRTAAFAWEEFDIDRVEGGKLTLRSAHGKFCAAELDGTLICNRDVADIWERFEPVAGFGGLGLKSHHGTFIVAEGGGGGLVRVDREYRIPGPWETLAPSKPLSGGANAGPGPPPPSGPLDALTVEGNGRFFTVGGTRYDLREISSFALQSRMLRGEAESVVRPLLRAYRANRFTQTRVILTLDGGYWTDVNEAGGAARAIGYSLRSAPDMPGFWESLHALVAMHAEEGLRTRLVILGALEPFGGVWDPVARRDIFQGDVRRRAREFAHEVARQMAGYPHVLLELANEPAAIGMKDSAVALGELACQVKAIAPGLMLNTGDIAGMEPVEPMYRCADSVDMHGPRDVGLDGIEAAKRWGEVPVRDQQVRPMPAMSGEPANACEPRLDGRGGGWSQVLREPIASYAYAAVSRVRQFYTNFHLDSGLYSIPWKPETQACIDAYHAGLDAIPLMEGDRWRGHWGLNRGDYWSDRLWPVSDRHPDGTDDPAEVEDWIRRGRGAWRAFGLGDYSVLFPTRSTPEFDWRPFLEAPAERTTFMVNGRYVVGIHRRQ